MSGPMMTAAYIEEPGPATAIRVGHLQVPAPGPTDVLVEVAATAVNPVDTYVRSGRYPTPLPSPFIVGRDLVGTVVEAPAATGLQPGDAVWCNSLGHDGRQGSFSEYAVVPADRLYRLPAGTDPVTAVAVAHPAATAFLGWFGHAALRAGETVFVGGGGGNVGTAAIQLAAFTGARVITTARPDDFARCRSAGAEIMLDYRDPHLAEQVAGAAPSGVDVVWETSGHHDFRLVQRVVTPGGRVLLTAATTEQSPVPWPALYTQDVRVLGFVISRASVADLSAAASVINQLLAAGVLTARIADVLPLARTVQAHQRLEAGDVSGRLVVRPD